MFIMFFTIISNRLGERAGGLKRKMQEQTYVLALTNQNKR